MRAADPLLPDDLEEVGARTRAGLEQVEEGLATAVGSADPFVHEAARHLLAAGGKRFRPTLVLLAGHFGDPTFAAGMELQELRGDGLGVLEDHEVAAQKALIGQLEAAEQRVWPQTCLLYTSDAADE